MGPHATSGNQYRADTATAIAAGGTIPTGVGVYFEANVTSDEGRTVRMEVELRASSTAFTGIANYFSSYVSSATRARTSTATALTAGNWYWRYRVVDSAGVASNWVLEGSPDFIVQASTTVPSVQTLAATGTSSATSATINGSITSDGGSSIIDRRFDLGTSSGNLNQAVYAGSISVSGNNFSANITGLSPGTTYYFRAWARNGSTADVGYGAGWNIGSILSFTTSSSCNYSISPSSSSPSASSGSGSFSVYVGSGCTWTASSDSTSWLHTSSTGSGNGTVSYSYDANTTSSSRVGHITAGGQSFTVTQAALSESADYPGATWIPAASANFGTANRTYSNVRWIIIHTTEGTTASAIQRFQDGTQQTSAHYIVSRDGSIIQLVHDKDVSYGCGNLSYNNCCINIEHERYSTYDCTPAQYQASANLVKWLLTQYGVRTAFPLVPTGIAPADPTAGSGIIGHIQVPDPYNPSLGGGANHHTDPINWNWTDYETLITGVTSPSIVNPTPGSTLSSSSATFQWSSGTGVTDYFLYVGRSPGTNDLYGQDQGLNLSATVNNLPSDGTTLYVRLWWQISGTWNYVDYTFTAYTQIDTTPPTVSITSPSTGTTYSTPQTINIIASASDNVGLSKVDFYDGATLMGSNPMGPYGISWSFTSANNGAHNWTARAYDSSGNITTSSVVSLNVSIPIPDTTPPTVSISSPTSGQSFTTSPVTVIGTATDPGSTSTGVSAVQIQVNSTSGTWQTASGTTSWSASVALNSGANTIYVRGQDGAGNYSTIASVSVTYTPPETVPPALTITSPANGAVVASASLLVSGTASDSGLGNSGISSVTVNGISATGGTTSGSGTANWSATVTLGLGANLITVAAKDTLSNSTQKVISVTYNEPSLTNIVFADNFSDNTIDSSKWTTSGNTVTEIGQTMQVLTTVQDQGGVLVSKPFAIADAGLITITRRVFLHHDDSQYYLGNNHFFTGVFSITVSNLPQFSIDYDDYDYSSSTEKQTYGFYVTRYGANAKDLNQQTDVSVGIPALWDTWFSEKITYDPRSGQLQYYTNNSLKITFNVGTMPISNTPKMSLYFQAYGWWTGHQQIFSNLVVSQVIAPPPPLLTGARVATNRFNFTLDGPIGSNFVIQASSNIVNWSNISTNTIPSNGVQNFSIPVPANQTKMFYRAVPLVP